MNRKELYLLRQDYITKYLPYQFMHYSKFNFKILDNIMYVKRPSKKFNSKTYNDCIIMFDTETSRKKLKASRQVNKLPSGLKARENHVCAWTISIRAFEQNIVTLWGHKPSTLIDTMQKIHDSMQGEITVMYAHNLSYDHWFCRRFMYRKWGTPEQQLNIKPHYPLYLEFANGIQIRDSLILAQRKLERWAKDMEVEHQKSVGKWDYNKLRNQNSRYNADELEYIEHDTLAGVECIDKLMHILNKSIYSMPFTSTGIIRDKLFQIARKHGAHDLFLRIAPTFEQYIKLTKVFHGGYVHANRFYIDTFIDILVQCYDFVSSYPFCMLAYTYPMEQFHKMRDMKIDEILKDAENTAYMFKLCGYKARLKKKDHVMPPLQYSKCVEGTVINPILDNGRIIECDYFEIYLNEVDLEVINNAMEFDGHICVEVEAASKDYLPRWFTDFIFELFKEKCMLPKGVLRNLKKSEVNGCYGMTVQKSIKDVIKEDYTSTDIMDAYTVLRPEDDKEHEKEQRKEYDKYLNKRTSILSYAWGCWVTSYAYRNVHTLNTCLKDENKDADFYDDDFTLLLYNDTDSAYAHGWDEQKIKAYNDNCIDLLHRNGYDSIVIGEHTFTLGCAEHKELEDDYSEFKTMGAKRYAGRNLSDNKIHITVAGVPKEKGAECLKDDLHNFRDNFVFKGAETGKKQHVYFSSDIYIDEDGNETADSLDLVAGDYELSCTEKYDLNDLFSEEIEVQVYDEID